MFLGEEFLMLGNLNAIHVFWIGDRFVAERFVGWEHVTEPDTDMPSSSRSKR